MARSRKQKISLVRAKDRAKEFCDWIQSYCSKFMVVGSIRRQRPEVNDVDIVAIPNLGGAVSILEWAKSPRGADAGVRLLKVGKTGMQFIFQGVQVDLYLATPETWWTLVIIRTGSASHNVKMCIEAKNKGWVLHVDGRGLYDGHNRRIEFNSEEEFFEKLGLPYKFPEERE